MTARGLLTPPQLISALPCFVCQEVLWMWRLVFVFVHKKKEDTITPMCESESLHPEALGKK